MPKEISALTHGEFDNAKNGPDQDESTDRIEHADGTLPHAVRLLCLQGWEVTNPHVEDGRGYNKKTEGNNLYEQTSNNNLLTDRCIVARNHQPSGPSLDNKGQNIGRYEYLREPSPRYN